MPITAGLGLGLALLFYSILFLSFDFIF